MVIEGSSPAGLGPMHMDGIRSTVVCTVDGEGVLWPWSDVVGYGRGGGGNTSLSPLVLSGSGLQY